MSPRSGPRVARREAAGRDGRGRLPGVHVRGVALANPKAGRASLRRVSATGRGASPCLPELRGPGGDAGCRFLLEKRHILTRHAGLCTAAGSGIRPAAARSTLSRGGTAAPAPVAGERRAGNAHVPPVTVSPCGGGAAESPSGADQSCAGAQEVLESTPLPPFPKEGMESTGGPGRSEQRRPTQAHRPQSPAAGEALGSDDRGLRTPRDASTGRGRVFATRAIACHPFSPCGASGTAKAGPAARGRTQPISRHPIATGSRRLRGRFERSTEVECSKASRRAPSSSTSVAAATAPVVPRVASPSGREAHEHRQTQPWPRPRPSATASRRSVETGRVDAAEGGRAVARVASATRLRSMPVHRGWISVGGNRVRAKPGWRASRAPLRSPPCAKGLSIARRCGVRLQRPPPCARAHPTLAGGTGASPRRARADRPKPVRRVPLRANALHLSKSKSDRPEPTRASVPSPSLPRPRRCSNRASPECA